MESGWDGGDVGRRRGRVQAWLSLLLRNTLQEKKSDTKEPPRLLSQTFPRTEAERHLQASEGESAGGAREQARAVRARESAWEKNERGGEAK